MKTDFILDSKTQRGLGLIGIVLVIAMLAVAAGGAYYLLRVQPSAEDKIENNANHDDIDRNSSASMEIVCPNDGVPACLPRQTVECRSGEWVCVGQSSDSGTAAQGDTITASSSAGTKSETETAKPSVAAVAIQNFAFGPKELRVKVGTKVVWTNNDSVSHNALSDTGVFDGPLLANGQSYERVFDQAGVFPYHCAPHPYMTAKVIVE